MTWVSETSGRASTRCRGSVQTPTAAMRHQLAMTMKRCVADQRTMEASIRTSSGQHSTCNCRSAQLRFGIDQERCRSDDAFSALQSASNLGYAVGAQPELNRFGLKQIARLCDENDCRFAIFDNSAFGYGKRPPDWTAQLHIGNHAGPDIGFAIREIHFYS